MSRGVEGVEHLGHTATAPTLGPGIGQERQRRFGTFAAAQPPQPHAHVGQCRQIDTKGRPLHAELILEQPEHDTDTVGRRGQDYRIAHRRFAPPPRFQQVRECPQIGSQHIGPRREVTVSPAGQANGQATSGKRRRGLGAVRNEGNDEPRLLSLVDGR